METNCPKVSVIIPVYNVEQYLEQSLNSVINQTLKEIEIICIDDCSTDGSLNILKEYAQKDNRIKIVKQERNQGQGVARNIGLDIATGEYIMFLDPDDWFELDACEVAYNQISKNKNDIVFFNLYNYNEERDYGIIDNFRLRSFWSYTNNPQIKLKDLNTFEIVSAEIWYKIYRTEFLNKNNIRFATIRFGEDCLFTITAYLYADSVSVNTKCLYNYTSSRKNSSSNSGLLHEFELYIAEKENALKFIESKPEYSWLIKSYILYYIASLIHYYKTYKRNYPRKKYFLYNLLRNKFIGLNEKYQIASYLENEKTQRFFNNVVRYPYFIFKTVKFFKK